MRRGNGCTFARVQRLSPCVPACPTAGALSVGTRSQSLSMPCTMHPSVAAAAGAALTCRSRVNEEEVRRQDDVPARPAAAAEALLGRPLRHKAGKAHVAEPRRRAEVDVHLEGVVPRQRPVEFAHAARFYRNNRRKVNVRVFQRQNTRTTASCVGGCFFRRPCMVLPCELAAAPRPLSKIATRDRPPLARELGGVARKGGPCTGRRRAPGLPRSRAAAAAQRTVPVCLSQSLLTS